MRLINFCWQQPTTKISRGEVFDTSTALLECMKIASSKATLSSNNVTAFCALQQSITALLGNLIDNKSLVNLQRMSLIFLKVRGERDQRPSPGTVPNNMWRRKQKGTLTNRQIRLPGKYPRSDGFRKQVIDSVVVGK